MNTTTFEKRIVTNGNALAINVTKELKLLGLGKDDIVRVTLETVSEN